MAAIIWKRLGKKYKCGATHKYMISKAVVSLDYRRIGAAVLKL